MKHRGNSFYNTYRPRQFSEVLGQAQSVEILKKQAILDAFAHAYLLYGGSGTGKTSTARILASALNCPNLNGTGEPCGKCPNCKTTYEGANWDVIEMDGASQRGIDDIRELKLKAYLMPLGNKKVYIIDEAHALTDQAWNALLKLLEEPPPHLVLILCSTQPDKIPATVQSRCQRFVFNPLKAIHIQQKLKMIADDWGVNFNDVPEMLRANLERAVWSGNMREAENAFEQIIVVMV